MTGNHREVGFECSGEIKHAQPAPNPSVAKTLRVTTWRLDVFQLLACNLACLSIAALYYAWRDVYTHRRRRVLLRERVSYMLWVAANRVA